MNNKGFKDIKVNANVDFGFDDDYNSAIVNLGSKNNNGFNNDIIISDIKIKLKQFDALCYENVRLLVV